MLILNFLSLLFFSILLIKATDVLVSSLRALARVTKIGKYAITGLILAVATSLPELFVGVVAALEKQPNLSLGNVIGSNIANITVVVGIGAILGGSVRIRDGVVFRDLGHVFLISIAPLLLLFDKTLSRVDGLLLLVLYAFYASVLLQKRKLVKQEEGVFYRLIRRISYSLDGHSKQWARLFIGMLLLIFSADMIVRNATYIAKSFNVPVLLIGILVVAIGTSLPELAFEIKAIQRREASMAYGDILGSVAANATLILGVTSLITPITIVAFADYLLAVATFLIAFALFIIFIRTKRRLDRWEGLLLLLLYVFFVILELAR